MPRAVLALMILVAVPSLARAQHHLHFGTIPELCPAPTVEATSDGRWSSADTWSPRRVPAAGDRVLIPHGRTVTVDSESDAALECVGLHGRLNFAAGGSSRLTAGTVIVHPGGHLWMGDASSPVTGTAEIVIANRPTDRGHDPEQWGTGLLVFGRFDAQGSARTPFARTAVEPHAGHTTLTLSQPVNGWRAGDRVLLPDTRQVPSDDWFNRNYALQHEVRRIVSVSADGRTVTLDAPLIHTHAGARDADGTPTVLADGTRLLPHVANLTRSIQIRSQNPSGTRGHVLLTDRAEVNVGGVAFRDLGRTRAAPLDSAPSGEGTNQIGRYPVHFHHLRGPDNPANTGYQFVFADNVIERSEKWPIAIHGTHYGLVQGNVVYDAMGAGIVFENGSETDTLVRRNLVVHVIGTINPRDSQPGETNGMTPGSGGECYWSAGFNNRFVENVASGCRNPNQEIVSGVGFKFITPPAIFTTRNPRFRGADMTDPGQTIEVQPQRQQLREFRGNEVYGLAAVGFTAWQLGTDGYSVHEAQGESLVKDLRVWHTYDGAVWNYPAVRMTFEDLVYRIDPSASEPVAVTSGDYRVAHLTVRGGSIHARAVVSNITDPLGVYTLERINAVTLGTAFSFRTPATPGTGASRPASGVSIVLKGNVVKPWPGRPLRVLALRHDTSDGNSDPDDRYDVFVLDHQGIAGQNFRAYFKEQATQTLYGGRAPCGTLDAREGVDAITCPLNGPVPTPPPAAPPPPPTPASPDDPPPADPPPGSDHPGSDDGERHCSGRRCRGSSGGAEHAHARPTAASPAAAAIGAPFDLGGAGWADFDGDGRADIAVYDAASGTWTVHESTSGYATSVTYRFGDVGAVPVPGDYDGDGRTDLAVYSPDTGRWRVLTSRSGFSDVLTRDWGQSGDIAVPADYDGDGRTDMAVYRPATGEWLVLTSMSEFTASFVLE